MSATTIRYGRRGGGWLPKRVASPPPTPAKPRGRPLDLGRLFHPETIARARAHQRRHPGTCAADRDRAAGCDCRPDPADLAAICAGLARMATARHAAGQPLDDLDRQALDRELTRGAETR
jgi:hypothetical protein